MKLPDDDPPNGPTKNEGLSLRDVGVVANSSCRARNHHLNRHWYDLPGRLYALAHNGHARAFALK